MKTIRLALRSIFHFRLYSAVNVAGLALSLACVIIIFRYVYGELTVDRFNPDLDRLYVTYVQMENGDRDDRFTEVSNPNGDREFVDIRRSPAVEAWTNVIYSDEEEVTAGGESFRTRMVAADTSFMHIFGFPVVAGVVDPLKVNTGALSEEMARRMFGDEDPLGKQVTIASGRTVTITGIIGEPATRSSLCFDLLVSQYLTSHWSMVGITAVKLYPHQDYHEVNSEYGDFFYASQYSYSSSISRTNVRYQLFPLEDVYLNSSAIIGSFVLATGNRTNVMLLLTVGLLILLIGVANFINIYLAVIMRRGRELGMKKVFGASGEKVLVQLFAENFVLVAMSLVAALALVEVFSPVVRNLLGLNQIPFVGFDFVLAGMLLVLIPLVTTVFPYLRYRYSTPISELRSVGHTSGRGIMRRIFLLIQYVLTIFMIILSLAFNRQLHTMLNAERGYRTEGIIHLPAFSTRSADNVIYVSDEEWYKRQAREEAMDLLVRQKMDASPLFTKWAFGDSPVLGELSYGVPFSYGGGEFKEAVLIDADRQWLDLFEIELLDGRLFDDRDQWGDYAVIVSEDALDYYGISDWRSATLQPQSRLWWSSLVPEEEMQKNPPYSIIGVIRSFRGGHIGHSKFPALFTFSDTSTRADLFAVIAPGRKQEAIEFLRELREQTFGGEFTYTFIEDEVEAMYAEDRKVAAIYTIFTVIAILISMLGLFSMSLFDVQQRYNEIAIRKVNGATTGRIIGLLLKRYIVLLAAAFAVASPLAWLAVERYLEDFALRTPVSWTIFAAALAATVAVSLTTLIFQTARAARMNPAAVIRNE